MGEVLVLQDQAPGLAPQEIPQGKMPAIQPEDVILQKTPLKRVHSGTGQCLFEHAPGVAGRQALIP